MSVAVAIKTPSAVVLATESRTILQAGPGRYAAFDTAHKLWRLPPPNEHAAALVFGQTAQGNAQIETLISGYETDDRYPLHTLAADLMAYLKPHMAASHPCYVYLGGFDSPDQFGRLYEIRLPNEQIPLEQLPGNSSGVIFGGQDRIARRILSGFDTDTRMQLEGHMAHTMSGEQRAAALGGATLPVPLEGLPPDSLSDLAAELIGATIRLQRFTTDIQGCGGRIHTAIMLRGGKTYTALYSSGEGESLLERGA